MAQPTLVRASRLVVLSAGAFGTPSILERSGVGSAEVLKKHGVKQIIDLPGVGENYMDHNVIFSPYHPSEDAETMDMAFRGNEEEVKRMSNQMVDQWEKEGKGVFANNGIDAAIKLRPNEAELQTMSPAFDERWKSYYANKPDKPVMLLGSMAAYVGLNPAIPRGKYFSAHPISIGHVHITSGTDPYSPLNFAPGFLENFADVIILRWACKRARELARRMKFFRGELTVGHPQFPEGSAAAVGRHSKPVPLDAPYVQYTEEDDKAIDEYHRQTVETTWHSIGACAMKPREKGGIVDSKHMFMARKD
ncbi:hypothetical protein D9613_007490 [Agrocybe pediades]|uniref:pyranose dehydrogenase (acceptor) n=1 Tax=Agrocybe pediades TaxID=84607 RepID=A0A8H4QMJ0_9AGAR|nr:hypothetical protein D9613_007490 [Agrocybe pediades]